MKYIVIAFLLFSPVLYIILTHFKSADIVAAYTKNNLSWSGAHVSEDSSIKLDLKKGETTVQLKNCVVGNIGYSIYLYGEEETLNHVTLSWKDMTEIKKDEYPDNLKKCYVKYGYHGSVKGDGKKNFKINSTDAADLKLLIIIEDNNSYPKEEKPTIANVKFNAEVLLDGQYPHGREYSFSLIDESGKVIETVHNDGGYISFSNIALKEKGTYIYYILENEGKDKETTYDKAVYKITVDVKEKNDVRVFYEKDGIPKETLPRFSNYKEIKDRIGTEYPGNTKKTDEQTNYLLISTLAVGIMLILFYVVLCKKKG